MAALNHTLGLVKHDAGNAHMMVSRLIESRCNHLGIDTATHVGDLLGAFVNEENHYICLGVVFGYRIGDVLKEDGLTGLGRCHYQAALTLAYRREHVNDTGRYIA